MKRKVLAYLSQEDSIRMERINSNVSTFVTLISNPNFSREELKKIEFYYEMLKQERKQCILKIIRKYKLPMIDDSILHFSSNRNEVYIEIN